MNAILVFLLIAGTIAVMLKMFSASRGFRGNPFSQLAEVTDFLYLSGLVAAKNEALLTEKGITCVVAAAMESPELNYSSIKSMRLRLEDNAATNIGIHFDLVADKIEKVRKEKGKILVHCIAGVSRSATLVLAYMMKYQKMKLIDAHAHVHARRPFIRPNPGFWKELIDYEKKLFHKNTVTMVESDIGLVPSVYKEEVKGLIW